MSKKDPSLIGGTFTIPDGWFVSAVDFDADEPFCTIVNEKDHNEKNISIPKSLAYYLTTHHCGSDKFRKKIREQAQRDFRNAMADAHDCIRDLHKGNFFVGDHGNVYRGG